MLENGGPEFSVPTAYIDINGHMNIGYYSVLFDKALVKPYYEGIGVGRQMIERDGRTTFALESHLTYQREVKAGDVLRFDFRILDLDRKRAHLFLTMTHAGRGSVAATHETLSMCVDVATRRSAEWPVWIAERLTSAYESQKELPLPDVAGRRVGIRRAESSGEAR